MWEPGQLPTSHRLCLRHDCPDSPFLDSPDSPCLAPRLHSPAPPLHRLPCLESQDRSKALGPGISGRLGGSGRSRGVPSPGPVTEMLDESRRGTTDVRGAQRVQRSHRGVAPQVLVGTTRSPRGGSWCDSPPPCCTTPRPEEEAGWSDRGPQPRKSTGSPARTPEGWDGQKGLKQPVLGLKNPQNFPRLRRGKRRQGPFGPQRRENTALVQAGEIQDRRDFCLVCDRDGPGGGGIRDLCLVSHRDGPGGGGGRDSRDFFQVLMGGGSGREARDVFFPTGRSSRPEYCFVTGSWFGRGLI